MIAKISVDYFSKSFQFLHFGLYYNDAHKILIFFTEFPRFNENIFLISLILFTTFTFKKFIFILFFEFSTRLLIHHSNTVYLILVISFVFQYKLLYLEINQFRCV